MRKILSGFLATSMVVAMASTMSFAAVTKPGFSITVPAITIDDGSSADPEQTLTGVTGAAVTIGKWYANVKVTGVTATLQNSSSATLGKFTLPDITVKGEAVATPVDGGTDTVVTFTTITIPATEIVKQYHNLTFNQNIEGKVYSGKFVANGNNLDVVFNETSAIAGFSGVNFAAAFTVDSTSTDATVVGSTVTVPTVSLGTPTFTLNGAVQPGTGSTTADVEITGDFFEDLKNVVICDGNGNPLPMTEKGAGVDKDLNGSDGIQSDRTLYFMINEDTVPTLMDDNYWKIKVTKGDNAKIVKEITDTTKIFSSAMVNANNGTAVPGIDFTKRHRYIKVKLNELYTDDEYKVTLDMRISPTSKAETKYTISGDEIKVKDFSFWVKNIVKDADNEWTVGTSGLMLNPVTNDWNEVTYTDEEGDVAFMKFFGDSDTGKFYAKLSTKWAHEDYAAYFNDQDAFYFEFTGSPKLSSTSRADLQIYNPFVDEDSNETIDPTTATIYQVVDGDLIDVTDSFTYGEGDNGDDAFITRTRFLGSYIICEKPVEEAVGDSDIDDLMPDDLEVPDDVTPDAGNNGGGAKQPANTGRYL